MQKTRLTKQIKNAPVQIVVNMPIRKIVVFSFVILIS